MNRQPATASATGRFALPQSERRTSPLPDPADASGGAHHGHPDTPPLPFVAPEEPFWQQLQRELAQLVPRGRLVVAAQSGHDLHHEQPELVLDAITTSSKPRGLATWCPTGKTAR
jgi:pimeloyl-ACP methyl ester carboxylesterase